MPILDYLTRYKNFYTWAKTNLILTSGRIINVDYSSINDSNYGYITLDGSNKASITEGQSYGMFWAYTNDDYKTFDLVWQWTKANMQLTNANILASKVASVATALDAYKDNSGNTAHTVNGRNSLYTNGWIYRNNWDNTQNVTPKPGLVFCDSATDGDLIIAACLLLAYKRWGIPSYKTDAINILTDFATYSMKLCNGNYYLIMGSYSGFETGTQICVDSSYIHPWMFTLFALHDTANATLWNNAAAAAPAVVTQAKANNSWGAPSQQVGVNKTTGALGVFNGSGKDFEFDAFRDAGNFFLDGSASCKSVMNDFTHGLYKDNTDNDRVLQKLIDGGTFTQYAPSWNNFQNLNWSPYGVAYIMAQRALVTSILDADTWYQALLARSTTDYLSNPLPLSNFLAQAGPGYFAAESANYYPNWIWSLLFMVLGGLFVKRPEGWIIFNSGNYNKNVGDFNAQFAAINSGLGYPTLKGKAYDALYKNTDDSASTARVGMKVMSNAYLYLTAANQTAWVAELPSGNWAPVTPNPIVRRGGERVIKEAGSELVSFLSAHLAY